MVQLIVDFATVVVIDHLLLQTVGYSVAQIVAIAVKSVVFFAAVAAAVVVIK